MIPMNVDVSSTFVIIVLTLAAVALLAVILRR